MARKRTRRVARRRPIFARSRRRSTSGGFKAMNVILPSMAYGAGRQYLTQLASPITSRIPLGQYADEAVFGALGYFLAKKQKGTLRQIGISMLTVEAAATGNQIMAGLGNGEASTSNSSFVYG